MSSPVQEEKRSDDHLSYGTGKEYEIYTSRFSENENRTREVVWKILIADFFQQYISPRDVIVDLGAGDGKFITNVVAKRRIAVDVSAHVLQLQQQGIEVLNIPATRLTEHLDTQVDVVFMSNFLEHLPSKRVLLEVFEECHRALKPGGRVLILQPNIRYVGSAYWDFIDHHIALTEFSLVEALEISGFAIERLIPRFLPYTSKSRLGSMVTGESSSWIVRLYLNLPILWRIIGQQTFVAAQAI